MTAPGFADIGRISMTDIRERYEMRFWSDIGYPFEDYFDTITMLDKTVREWQARQNPPKK